MISTDAEGRVTFLNGVAESLTGWPQAEAVGRPLPDVFHIVNEATRQPVENPALRALREGTVVGLANHTVLIARDGTERPDRRQRRAHAGRGRRQVGAVLVFRDVTERKRAEEARALLAAIVESSDDAIVSKTLDGIIRSWNAGAERLFGYTRRRGRRPADHADHPAGAARRGARDPGAAPSRGERIEHFETVRVSKHGRRLDISLTVSPIRDGRAAIVGASKVARDITERKRAEEALREADRRKDEFLALLAHELRNPLAPLRNGLQVMRLAAGDASAVAQARGMMERQLGHMVRLIDDLLDVSRISRNKMELRRARVLLADVRQQRRGDGPPAHRRRRAHARRLAAARARGPRRRPDPAGPGLRQPAHQQRQVHRAGRPHLARPPSGGGTTSSSPSATTGSASRPSRCPASSTCSPRWTGASSAPPAGSASGWRS